MPDKERVWCKSPTPQHRAFFLKQLKREKHVSGCKDDPTCEERDALDELRRYASSAVEPDEISRGGMMMKYILKLGGKACACNKCSSLMRSDCYEENTRCCDYFGEITARNQDGCKECELKGESASGSMPSLVDEGSNSNDNEQGREVTATGSRETAADNDIGSSRVRQLDGAVITQDKSLLYDKIFLTPTGAPCVRLALAGQTTPEGCTKKFRHEVSTLAKIPFPAGYFQRLENLVAAIRLMGRRVVVVVKTYTERPTTDSHSLLKMDT